LRRPLESAQYVSIKYTERLAEAGVEPSVGSVGDSYDNALAETVNGLYKAEVIHRHGGVTQTKQPPAKSGRFILPNPAVSDIATTPLDSPGLAVEDS
jgi:transposase InsO family protein